MPPKPPLTHFLCLPLVTEGSRSQLRTALEQFVTESRDAQTGQVSIPPRAFRPLETLHLTLGVMSLLEPEQVDNAVKLLYSLDLSEILRSSSAKSNEELLEAAKPDTVERASGSKPDTEQSTAVCVDSKVEGPRQSGLGGSSGPEPTGPLVISLRSLVSMHNPAKTSILYAKPVDSSERLLPFCRLLKDRFVEAGLLVPDDRPLLLHATMLNTVYVPTVRQVTGRTRGHGHRKAKLTIDATMLLDKYKDFSWASNFKLQEVAICKMGAKKLTNEHGDVVGEKYEQVASKPL